MLDLVSVVIPFYNGNKYFHETLNSIAQNASMLEEVIIVVDHNSEKPCYLDSEFQLPIKVVNNFTAERGPGVCRAIGYNTAKARFVAFLDSDDLWAVGKLEMQVKLMLQSGLAFSFHAFKHFSLEKEYPMICPSADCTVDNFLSKAFVVGCLTVMVDKSKVPSVSANTLKMRNDYFMWYQIIKYIESRSMKWGAVNGPAAYHRLHRESLTSSRLKSVLAQFVLYRKCGLTYVGTFYYLSLYFIRGLGSR